MDAGGSKNYLIKLGSECWDDCFNIMDRWLDLLGSHFAKKIGAFPEPGATLSEKEAFIRRAINFADKEQLFVLDFTIRSYWMERREGK